MAVTTEMPVRKILIALFACCFSATCLAQLKSDSLGGMLKGYIDLLEKNCPGHAATLADVEAKGDIGGIVMAGQFYQTMCVCHPAKTRALLESLPPAKLSAQAVGENAFVAHATPGIQEPCVAEQFNTMFAGESCDGYKMTDIQKGTEEAAFCGCMRKVVDGWAGADAEIAALFRDIGSYSASFRAAKANNTAHPERTPRVDRYITALNQCGGGGEFQD